MKRTTTSGRLSRFWRGDHHVRRLRLESLEQRQLLTATVLESSVTPSLASGTLASGVASLTIPFSEPVLGGGLAANYELRGLGPDNLLGTPDDLILPLSVSYSNTVATLSFTALPESTYRLTVHDVVTDAAGRALDGDSNGAAGGDWVREFVTVPPDAGFFVLPPPSPPVALRQFP
jgi:hypothetical protein